MASFLERFKSAASVFKEPELIEPPQTFGNSFSSHISSRTMITNPFISKASVVAKIYNQIAVDVASATIKHVRTGQNGRYEDDISSDLNRCLTFRPNIDQTSRAFYQDLVWTLADEGYLAVVPVDTTANVYTESSFDVKSMRVGKITHWYPRHVKVELYNDRTGQRQEVILPKENVAIMVNPLYEVMNKPNSDLVRLTNKLDLVDKIDSQMASGKLDLIIQLPYEVRSEMKREQAARRREDIEAQLRESSLGIAYIGATERVTQLNRAVTNNLLEQIETLTKQVYSSLGLTEDIFNGTASAQTLTNYYNRTINPILEEITSAMSWAFLTQTARTQGQAVRWFRSPFAMVPMEKFPEIAVQLSSAEIATSNEIRSELGWKPSGDPRAEQLRNPNVNPREAEATDAGPVENTEDVDTEQSDDRPLGEIPISKLI